MSKYCEFNDDNISLHDCRATSILYENGIVTFGFKDGFWILNHSCDEPVRTNEAEVQYNLEFGNIVKHGHYLN